MLPELPDHAALARLQLHHTLARLILRRWTINRVLSLALGCCLLARRVFRLILIGYYVRRENALLRLFTFNFEGRQRVKLIIVDPPRRRIVLALIHRVLVYVTIHSDIHVRSTVFLDLRALVPRVACVDWRQHALLELHALIYVMLLLMGLRRQDP